jgi:hypothetical protein
MDFEQSDKGILDTPSQGSIGIIAMLVVWIMIVVAGVLQLQVVEWSGALTITAAVLAAVTIGIMKTVEGGVSGAATKTRNFARTTYHKHRPHGN